MARICVPATSSSRRAAKNFLIESASTVRLRPEAGIPCRNDFALDSCDRAARNSRRGKSGRRVEATVPAIPCFSEPPGYRATLLPNKTEL